MKFLVIISKLRMGLFLTIKDLKLMEETGEVVLFSEEEVENCSSKPEVYARLDKAVSECDFAFAVGGGIPEEIFLKYNSIKAYAIARIGFKRYSAEFFRTVFERGQYILAENPAFSIACAEYAFTLMLNTMRNASHYNLLMHQGQERWRQGDYDILDYLKETGDKSLYESNVGIIGFGQIARALVGFLKPFRPVVRAFDPYITEALAAEHGVELTSLETVLKTSDIVVLLAHPNQTNVRMINKETLSLMKEGARLVNIARSPLVDTQALVDWLKAGKGKAALDVFDQEPLPADSELRKLPNLFLSPHRAASITDTYNRIGHYAVLDFLDIAKGREPSRTLKATPDNLGFYLKSIKTVN